MSVTFQEAKDAMAKAEVVSLGSKPFYVEMETVRQFFEQEEPTQSDTDAKLERIGELVELMGNEDDDCFLVMGANRSEWSVIRHPKREAFDYPLPNTMHVVYPLDYLTEQLEAMNPDAEFERMKKRVDGFEVPPYNKEEALSDIATFILEMREYFAKEKERRDKDSA